MKFELATYLHEDLGEGDITSELVLSGNEVAVGEIIVHESCVLAGVNVAKQIFESLQVAVELPEGVADGMKVKKDTVVLRLCGVGKSILGGERLALNFLARMSGIATLTRKFIEKCKKYNPDIEIAATRKTTPGFRYYEKYAVKLAGGFPHRQGLYDGILIKDNHIRLVGDVESCILRAQKMLQEWAQAGRKLETAIEIEVESVKDAEAAARAGADVIMLNNFTPEAAKIAYERIKSINPRIKVEVSGGITLQNVQQYARYADRISIGRLTHSTKAVEFSLELRRYQA
jgi:nicotinate-nucleotide pyrophosphorylase (carboxylating)